MHTHTLTEQQHHISIITSVDESSVTVNCLIVYLLEMLYHMTESLNHIHNSSSATVHNNNFKF